jgi:hypothetical protein
VNEPTAPPAELADVVGTGRERTETVDFVINVLNQFTAIGIKASDAYDNLNPSDHTLSNTNRDTTGARPIRSLLARAATTLRSFRWPILRRKQSQLVDRWVAQPNDIRRLPDSNYLQCDFERFMEG